MNGQVEVDGDPDPDKPGYMDLTVHYQTPVYTTLAKAGGLFTPEDSGRGAPASGLFDATDSDPARPLASGPVYGLEARPRRVRFGTRRAVPAIPEG